MLHGAFYDAEGIGLRSDRSPFSALRASLSAPDFADLPLAAKIPAQGQME